MITALAAAKAYAATQNVPKLASVGTAESPGADFGQMLKGVLNESVTASRKAENLMTAHVAGKAELVDVVTAISSAETSLETVMAVRDQVISAYQEIMRMPI